MIDTHAHLLSLEKMDEIIENMANDEMDYIVNIGTTLEDSRRGVELAKEHEKIYTTVGIYPEFSRSVNEDDLKELDLLAGCDKVVAIGEIGLDYHNEYDKESQKKLLIKQLEIADKHALPFCIHCRNAGDDLFEILNENKHLINHSGLMHCYSEGKEMFQKFLDLGLYLSFSGNITFKKTDRSFLKDIPLDKILVETDSPYLSPEPLRGRINQPKNVMHIIDRIAFEIGVSSDELRKITTENAKKFYNLR